MGLLIFYSKIFEILRDRIHPSSVMRQMDEQTKDPQRIPHPRIFLMLGA